MIELRNVTKRYGDKVAVDDLSLVVPEGEVAVLIGPSGCGKTTTLRMVNRLIEPTSGSIFVQGEDTSQLKPEELRRHVGYVIQSVGLFPHLTVAENVATVPRLLGWQSSRIGSRVTELLELVSLPPDAYGAKYPRQLSGGEAQRVGVARALAADPPVLLMDEPFGAVDPLTRDRLQAEFARIQRDLRKTVIFVTHDVDEAIRLADRIALMRAGHLEQYDTPEELLDAPANKFVHDFVGADAALKRLGRVRVGDVMDTAVTKMADGSHPAEIAERAACDQSRFVYLVGDGGKLEGWFDCQLAESLGAEASITSVDWSEVSVRSDASLREALSLMLARGFRSLAVTDARGTLLGAVSLTDVEREIAERASARATARVPGERPE
jgi:osmoprotectant transport system ATP-binding protein